MLSCDDRRREALEAGAIGEWQIDLETWLLDGSTLFVAQCNLDAASRISFDDLQRTLQPADAAKLVAALETSIALDQPFEVDVQVRQSGRWLQLKGRALQSESGAAQRAVGVSLDISRRRQREDDLHQASFLLRAVLETAPGLIYAKDADGRMLIANPPTLDLIGKPWDRVKGKTDSEFLEDAVQGEFIMKNDRRIMAAGRAEVLEEIVATADGQPCIWLSAKGPLRDDAGEVVGLVGVSQNITARKQAEERLQELNETLETRVAERTFERDRAWNTAQDLLVALDSSGFLKTVNPAWTAILGWSTHELIDHHFLEFIHADDHPSSRGALAEAGDGPLMHYENRLLHKDGSYRWVEWAAAPDGDRIYASGRHITAEKEAAAALADKAAQLEASNRELESFSYSVSHDLRAPLRAIDGFGLMLADDYGERLDTEGLRLLNVIRDSSRRMGMLIDDLLAFSRLGHVALAEQQFDMATLVREVIDELQPVSAAARVDFDLGPLEPSRGDRGLLRQVWVNLLSNAIKYSAKQAVPKVEIRSVSEDGETVYMISDNGVGFDMRYVDKLFKVFHRLHAATEFPGTGVGLALVSRIVSRHGGRVWAEGRLGQGAMFSFGLPKQRPPLSHSMRS